MSEQLGQVSTAQKIPIEVPMSKLISLMSALFLLSTTAIGAEIDTSSSVITWTGTKVTGSGHTGNITPQSSDLKVTDGQVQSGSVVLDMNSLTVTDLEGKKAANFLKHMMSEDFFEVGKFPTATLKLNENKGGEMIGELTVKGQTHPITFSVKQEDGKYVGKATFDRTKFGVVYRSGNFFKDLGDKVINDDVEVVFSIALKSE